MNWDEFCLGVAPERIIPATLGDLQRQYANRPALMDGALREYQDNVRVRWNLHTNAIEGSTLSFANTTALLLDGAETLPNQGNRKVAVQARIGGCRSPARHP